MKIGKLSEAVEQRSVLKRIRARGKEPAGVVAFEQEAAGTGKWNMATGELVLEYPCQIDFLANRVAGLIAAEGAEAVAVIFGLMLPTEAEEAELKQLVRRCQETAERLGIADYTVQSRCSSVVTKPALTVTMTGKAIKKSLLEKTLQTGQMAEQCEENEAVEHGMRQRRNEYTGSTVIMAGYAAMEATVCMMDAEAEQLAAKLSGQYLRDGREKLLETDTRPAISIAAEYGALIKTAGEGGIFTALWELGGYLDCGMRIELRELLLCQETIEVCEILDLNPYLMMSGGAILAVTNEPETLLAAYEAAGIPAAVVGVLTEGHDRILQNGEEQRFLEPFREDELYRAGILH